jgi:catechol 2,3-dioxygenase-like lactoylglutathione lyase family enzyme
VSEPPPILRSRVAWQTELLEECVRFYHELVGLPVLWRFDDHANYDGVILGLPDSRSQLELTTHRLGSPASPSAADDLLVLYLGDRGAVDGILARCRVAGVREVEPENPYWEGRAVLLRDPDGRTLVLDWGLAED